MSQSIITTAFEQWKAQEAAGGNTVVLDEFVLANVPGLDPDAPIDRTEGLPPAEQIVHRQRVNKTGVVNNNAVVYSVT
ncbi:phage tail protein, partial [Yersinia ruckeri]